MATFLYCLFLMIVYPISEKFKTYNQALKQRGAGNANTLFTAYVFALAYYFSPYYNNFYFGFSIMIFFLQTDFCMNKLSLIFVS